MSKILSSASSVKPADKAIIVYACVLALLVPTVAFASDYWSTLSFSTALKGATRYYDRNNINISMDSRATAGGSSHLYYVQLNRSRWWGSQALGTISVLRNGRGNGRWSGVGSGNYFFYFSKANDGAWVTSNNVHMWSD